MFTYGMSLTYFGTSLKSNKFFLASSIWQMFPANKRYIRNLIYGVPDCYTKKNLIVIEKCLNRKN